MKRYSTTLLKRLSFVVAAVSVCGCLAARVAQAADARKPNIILINIDDLGYGDIGPYGSNNKTPNLDRMAKEGRRLTSHYAAPVCSPSRAALMTGCYPKRSLPIPHVLFPVSAVGLNPDEVTIAEVLKGQGYATACFGKWHLGDQAEFLPTRQGFDVYLGIPYSNDMGTAADGSKSNFGRPLPKPNPQQLAQTQREEDGVRGAAQPPLPLVEGEKVVGRVRAEEQAEVTRRYTERTIGFIREHKDEPFFVYLPHNAVHWPDYPSQDFRGTSPNGLLGDWIQEVDWSVGQILNTLRELKLDSNTFVLFTSDNGGPVNQGAHNGPLRGSKGSTFEGGIRSCSIAWWPGKIPAGTQTAAITSMMDVLPTVAKLAGAELPKDRKLDGVDIWPVVTGDPAEPPRDHFFYFRGLKLEAVRLGPWKLHLALADNAPGKAKTQPIPQLFNLSEDIGESKNLADAHPEIVAKLQTLALSMQDDLGLDGKGPGVRPLGRVADPQPLIAQDGAVREDAVGASKSFP